MPYATATDGTRLFYKDWGQGRPLVLLHGWPLTGDTFDDAAVALAEKGFRSIIPDRRGFGRSDQPWTGYDYDTFTDDVAAILDHAGIRDPVGIVGFSMGGGEVARFQTKYPGRSSATVLIGAVVPYMLKTADNPDGVDASVFDDMTQGMTKDRAKFWSGFFKDFFGVGMVSHPVSAEVIDWARSTSMQAGLKPTLACAKAFATTDFRPDLAAFKVPTLIIHGTDDKTVPIDASARKAVQGIAGARLIEYDGAPHGLFATHKDRLIADVMEFLSR